MPAFIYTALSVLPIGSTFTKNSSLAYSTYVLPGMIAMVIMQSGIYGLAYWMVDLKARGALKKLNATPMPEWQMVLSLIASRTLIIFGQVIVLTLLGVFFFNAKFSGNIISVFLLSSLGGGIFLSLGLLISAVSKTYESAAPITSAIGLPMTFLGNIFYPIEILPNSLRIFAKALPITYLADGLRQAYLLPFNFQIIFKDILILGCWLVGITLLTIKVYKHNKT